MQDVDAVVTAHTGHDSEVVASPAGQIRTSVADRPVLDARGEWTPPRQLLREVWDARDLIATLARKDFFVRYRRASFGVAWAVLLPVIQAAVLTEVFQHFRAIRSGTHGSLPVYVFTGMTVYTFFTTTVTSSSTSIVDGAGLSSKIYFPRAVLPLISVRSNLYAFACSLVILIVMSVMFGTHLDAHVLLLVPGVLLLVWVTASAGLTLSALHVYFRDVRYIVAAIFSGLLYLSPVFLPLRIYPPSIRWIVLVNPVSGVIELFRLAITGADPQWPLAITFAVAWAVFLTATAVYLHCRRNRVFVDLL
ncbi:MAG: ABC transporter permease [Actinomycetes bacterium]